MKKIIYTILFTVLYVQAGLGQSLHIAEATQSEVKPYKITSAVSIDGKLEEPFWADIEGVTNFINQFPEDVGLASSQTIIKIAFDEKNLYVGAILEDIHANHIIRTLKRDNENEYFGSDGLGIVIDPVNIKSNGYFFGVNAAGAEIEGLLRVSGTSTNIDVNWNTKWKSAVSTQDSTWFIEMAIPFKSLKYDPKNLIWGLNFVRNDMKQNYYTTWSQVPRNLNSIDLGYLGQLKWEDEPPISDKKNVILTPYLLGGASKDISANSSVKSTKEIGLDAKIGITSSLNLDLTLNPDFSTVEVDQQVTDLSRFSIFFPEKRAFFIENSDLFNSFGSFNVNPFFSRRIGLDRGQQVPILFGSRLSGNATENLRLGVMTVQTSSEGSSSAQNYSVAAFQQRIFKRSSVKGLFVNRQSTQSDDSRPDYNRVGALEIDLLTKDGKWAANAGILKSFNPVNFDNEEYYKASIRTSTRNYFVRFNAHRVGENFLADVGFVPRINNFDADRDTTIRKGYYQFGHSTVYNFYPENGNINRHGPRIIADAYLNLEGSLNESFAGLFYFIDFKNQNSLEAFIWDQRVKLPFSTFIVGSTPFVAGDYEFQTVGVRYNSDPRRALSGNLQFRKGEFYNGKRTFFSSDVNFRVQPWGNFGFSYDYNNVQLPDPFSDFDFHLLGPKSEVSFSKNLAWTTFLQYNTQSENFNVNSRLQWRYSPLSDFFLVYTDNYNSETLAPKNRAVLLKINYSF